MAERWLTDLADVVADAERDGAPVFVGEHDVIERLTGFHLHRGALAAMHRSAPPALADVFAARAGCSSSRTSSTTNVGAVFRPAAALGVDAVLVTPRCADPLYRRSIRVSMGTVFQVPWTRVAPWPGGVDALHDLGFTVAALALADGSVGLDGSRGRPTGAARPRPRQPRGTASPAPWRPSTPSRSIPMAGGVDSLNVAAAGAVAAWALRVER